MKNKATFVANRMPYDAENKTLSKADFQKKMRAAREREAQLKAYEQQLKEGAAPVATAVNEPPVVEAPKKLGRPKKTE